MNSGKTDLMIKIVTADVVSAIIEEPDMSVQEAMKAFYNSEVFEKLCDVETGLYRESGGYVHSMYKNR